jgi:hypothetical protein
MWNKNSTDVGENIKEIEFKLFEFDSNNARGLIHQRAATLYTRY